METVGFIGVGDLALYTIGGVRHGGYTEAIMLSPRNRENSQWLARNLDCEVLPDNQSVIEQSNLVVIATRPPQCLETLQELEFRPDQVLISVVAGIPIAQLRENLNREIEIVRAMPVSSAEVGSSPTLIYPENPEVFDFFAYCGQVIGVDDEAIFDQGSVLASVYSWFFALFEELIEATQSPALPPDIAAKLVMGMAKGAAELALVKTDLSPGEIAHSIATEGTYSKLGLDLLEQNKAFAPWREASEMLRQKLNADT